MYALAVEVPRFDAREIGIVRLFGKFIELREYKLNKQEDKLYAATCGVNYLNVLPVLHSQRIHLVYNHDFDGGKEICIPNMNFKKRLPYTQIEDHLLLLLYRELQPQWTCQDYIASVEIGE